MSETSTSDWKKRLKRYWIHFSATFISQNEIWAPAPMRTGLPLRRRDDQKVFLGLVPPDDSACHTIIQTGEISVRFDPTSNNRFRS